ncbi:acyltransferase [Streptomyces sp. CNQ085]|uniref:acyltransferase family protein n=1 Tax=Streptomyces sp. CNQ085 TaxID=2886944 RepID=UPI001F505099|nr:acyltransferase [Streptomyces sp. CNQ085]MCI0383172.1 acyltransferase [Streptomyces sp. CNQ085]
MSQHTPGPRAPEASRLPALTGMRFIAAAMVFFFHAVPERFFTSEHSQNVANTIFYQGGWTGVGFFFILSGFILTWTMRADDTTPAFLRRRFFKIYPLHLLTLIAAMMLAAWVAQASVSGRDVALQLLLLHSWSPDIMVRASLNGVAWSLSCEALFYALFPILIRIIGRIRPERLWRWAGAVVAAIFTVPFVADRLPDQEVFPAVNVTAADLWLVYQFPGTRLLDFVFGIILARVVMEGRRLPLSFGGSAVLVAVAYVATPFFPSAYHLVAIMVVPLGLLVASAARAESSRLRNWLSSRAMVWLGEISFAFYITHQLVQVYGHRFLGAGKTWDTPQAIGVIALLFAVTLLLSWALYTLVEHPIMRRFATSRGERRDRAAQKKGPGPNPLSGQTADPEAEKASAAPAARALRRSRRTARSGTRAISPGQATRPPSYFSRRAAHTGRRPEVGGKSRVPQSKRAHPPPASAVLIRSCARRRSHNRSDPCGG